MHDSELKKLLLETCPVRPGQEARAWASLRDRLHGGKQARSSWSWLYYPTWHGLGVAAVAIMLAPLVGSFLFTGYHPLTLATADSQAPGVYATAFYSNSAKAQVVWLNGMDPATDKLTYLDSTRVIADQADQPSPPAGDPNSL